MRAHMYQGRERGVMLIGSAAEIRWLGERLIAGADAGAKPDADWPTKLAECDVSDNPKDPYTVSVHLDTASRVPATNTNRASGIFYVFAVLTPFAIFGAYSMLKHVLIAF